MRKVSEHDFDGSATVVPLTKSHLFTHECPLGDAPTTPRGAEPIQFSGLEQLNARYMALRSRVMVSMDGSDRDLGTAEFGGKAYEFIRRAREACKGKAGLDDLLLQVNVLVEYCHRLRDCAQEVLERRDEMLVGKQPGAAPKDPLTELLADIERLEQDITAWEKALGLPVPFSEISRPILLRIMNILTDEDRFKTHAEEETFDVAARVKELLPQGREHLLADYEAQRKELSAQPNPEMEAALARFSELIDEVEPMVPTNVDVYLLNGLTGIRNLLTRRHHLPDRENHASLLSGIATRVVTYINETPSMGEDLHEHLVVIQSIICDAEAFLQEPKPEPGRVFKGKALKEWERELRELQLRMEEESHNFGSFRHIHSKEIQSAKAELPLLPRMKIAERFIKDIIEAHTALAKVHRIDDNSSYLEHHVAKLMRLETVIAALKVETEEPEPAAVNITTAGEGAEALFAGGAGTRELPKEPEPA